MAEMAGLSAPTMVWASTDVPQAFKKFKTICQLMFDGPLAEKTEAVKVKYLLMWSGEEGIDVSSTWDLTDNESNTLSVYWDRFRKYVAPKSNFTIAGFNLRSMKQDNGESVDAYMKTVRILVYCRSSMGHSSSLYSTPEVDTGTLSWTKKVPTTQHSTLLMDDTDS